jgi:hypothetical protein
MKNFIYELQYHFPGAQFLGLNDHTLTNTMADNSYNFSLNISPAPAKYHSKYHQRVPVLQKYVLGRE